MADKALPSPETSNEYDPSSPTRLDEIARFLKEEFRNEFRWKREIALALQEAWELFHRSKKLYGKWLKVNFTDKNRKTLYSWRKLAAFKDS